MILCGVGGYYSPGLSWCNFQHEYPSTNAGQLTITITTSKVATCSYPWLTSAWDYRCTSSIAMPPSSIATVSTAIDSPSRSSRVRSWACQYIGLQRDTSTDSAPPSRRRGLKCSWEQRYSNKSGRALRIKEKDDPPVNDDLFDHLVVLYYKVVHEKDHQLGLHFNRFLM